MSVERNLYIRILTNLDGFSDIIKILIDNGFCFNSDRTITSLEENDVDDFNYIDFKSFEIVKKILDKREESGQSNSIVMMNYDINERFIIRSVKLANYYSKYRGHYEINFDIGHGIRISGAERYTDFGSYLNKIIPIFVKNNIYICEVKCSDYDC
ncbi:hypothetical protein [Clostridium beijerinckii]|uniref:hypothetical protein n=1 Tax=Clostridium beijerinckii TaxID=1520 RepID=UPI00156DE690|nr:hypothetical protein [Clostridium beijerinckii]NRT72104.1 hypothetical protein [Clostridium beijerinckii]